MVQAMFDDENPETVGYWRYPDTKIWDPDRNTNEFCANLPTYKEYGLLAVTVGLQGGGPVYNPLIYDNYINSAFDWDGTLKPNYFKRLGRILKAADDVGIIVIINYFYWQQNRYFHNPEAVKKATFLTTKWILEKGFRNVLIDINNEVQEGPGILESKQIHELVEIVQSENKNGFRLLVGTSIHPRNPTPEGKWSDMVDFFLPHGNDSPGEKLRYEIRNLKMTKSYTQNPRPILINEDSIDVNNLDIAVDEGASWGFYSQGFGSEYRDFRWDWSLHPREINFEHLSGYQTPPVNWSINTDFKKMFFNRVRTITGY
jgi:hypothetical protein